MQIEKFYQAQDIHKEVIQMKDILTELEKPEMFNIKMLEKLHVNVKNCLQEKTVDTLKKELNKLIKQREKEFNGL